MNSTPTHYALITFKAILALLWISAAAAAYAGVSAGKASDIVLDPTVTVLTCILSTLAGATALFIRINNMLLSQEAARDAGLESKKFVRRWLFAIAHMSGSWMAGTLAFLLGHAYAWDVWYGLIAVVLMSFGGATLLEKLAERYLPVIPLGPPSLPKP
jgi:hypothetical protein